MFLVPPIIIFVLKLVNACGSFFYLPFYYAHNRYNIDYIIFTGPFKEEETDNGHQR